MKRFSFAFDKLLAYRDYIEKEKKSDFALVLKEYVEIDNVIKDSQKESIRILRQRLSFIKNNNLDVLYYGEQSRIGLKHKIKDYQQKKEEKSIPLEKARKELIEAKKNKRSVEILKEKKWKGYIKEFEKEEQRELDEFCFLKPSIKAH